jgi:transcription-repair coupling factor (superfamily II helicase)
VAALLPEDYVPDVHLRLILYKRISAAASDDELRELSVELIDRFGLLPDATKNLVRIAAIRRKAGELGIEKIDASDRGGYVVFGADSRVDPLALVTLVQEDSRRFRLQGPNRLQFRDDLGDLERRFATIEELLDRLGAKERHDE